MESPTDLQKAYFAGFYEGEGTIANDKSNGNRLRLSIYQNDPTPLYLAQTFWGGKVYSRTRKSPASDKICTCHEWRLNHNDTLLFLDDIRPFMIIPYKIGQVEKALETAEGPSYEEYKCNFCDKIYANSAGRRRHEKKEHIDKGTEFNCDLCERTYKSRDSLMRHKRINHSSPDASGGDKSPLQDTSLRELPKAPTTADRPKGLSQHQGNDLGDGNNVGDERQPRKVIVKRVIRKVTS